MRPCLLLPLLLLAAAVTPVAGQSTVTGIRDLNFGIVIRGVQTTVAPGDPIRSGRFYARHLLNRPVQLRFTLPTTLARVGGGGTLPISFGTNDAVAQGTAGNSVPTYKPTRNLLLFELLGLEPSSFSSSSCAKQVMLVKTSSMNNTE